MDGKTILDQIKDGIIVSCQAREGWPMHGSDIMAAFAKAAEIGGAVGIRANGPQDIKSIQEAVELPIIGINKIFDNNEQVYITPTVSSVEEIIDLDIDIIALDATLRARPNNEKLEDLISYIRKRNPSLLIMGEVSTIEEAQYLQKHNVDIDLISTTLSGYTEASKKINSFDSKLVEKIVSLNFKPVIAEGKIQSHEDVIKAYQAGAHSVVIGTSITRPEILTERYVNAARKYKEE